MNHYNIIKQYKRIDQKQSILRLSLFLSLLFNLWFTSALVAQKPDVKTEPKKAQPDGISGQPPLSPFNGLSERRIKKMPRFEDTSGISGRIVMAICVNKKGKVVSADYLPAKSTIADKTLIHKVTQNAKEYKFLPTKKKGKECGTITFNFKHQ